MMKRMLLLALAVALAACDQATDRGAQDQAAATAGAANVADTAQPQEGSQTPADQPRELKAHVFQFGIYKAVRKGQIKDSPETNTGKVVRKPTLEHEKTTDRIPLLQDTYFGYQFRLFNLPPEAMIKPVMELRKVLIHPEMTLPDGSTTTGWDHPFKARVETQQVLGFDGYGFNEDYELVEGDWIFQIWYKDRKLIERKFVSYHPQEDKPAASREKE
jgi:hypothetical protein